MLIEGNDNANAVGDMIDVSYAPGGALGCTFFPEAVDVSAQFHGSPLDRDADVGYAGAEFPADLILDIMLQFCVTPHGLALGPHGTDRRFSSRVYQSLQRGVLPQDQNENRSESRMRPLVHRAEMSGPSAVFT